MTYSDSKGTMDGSTAVSAEALAPVIAALNTLPEDMTVHKGLKERVLKRRADSLTSGKDIEWGTAEALAFGSLLNEGVHVRVSGQDVERATFSQRNAVLHCQKTNATYTSLEHISSTQAPFTITNSSLSEYGVLGFECGYSQHNPNALVIWEAQFGDFANGAQIIFDQFLSAGESKWNIQQAVVVSMPHGYDGNGPEHSSGRIERFLQSVSEDIEQPVLDEVERHQRCNMEVTYPSTPAQYFHLLRRHVKRSFRKPLINFFSKQFLRTPNVSTLEEMTAPGTKFLPVIPDGSVPPSEAKRLVLCTGQIYHILNKHRQAHNIRNVALVRVEQLAPFPAAEIQSIVKDYPLAELVWVQEEPKNMGAFWHVEPRIEFLCDGKRIRYIGRVESASPATGFKTCHDLEEQQIIAATFSL
jgi:2-oxoglutarate dehydrogenase E1 component